MNPDFATPGLAQQELDDWGKSRYGLPFLGKQGAI